MQRYMPWAPAIFLLSIAAFLYLYAFMAGMMIPLQREQAARRIETLPLVTFNSLRDLPEGERVLIEGTISANNQADVFDLVGSGEQAFVIYRAAHLREDVVAPDGSRRLAYSPPNWVVRPLSLLLTDGTVQLINSDYRFWPTYTGYTADLQTRVEGITQGDRVLVEGIVAQGETPSLYTVFIHPGPRGEYAMFVRGGTDAALRSASGDMASSLGFLIMLGGLVAAAATWLYQQPRSALFAQPAAPVQPTSSVQPTPVQPTPVVQPAPSAQAVPAVDPVPPVIPPDPPGADPS